MSAEAVAYALSYSALAFSYLAPLTRYCCASACDTASVQGLASTTAMHTAVLPMPTSSHSQPPRIPPGPTVLALSTARSFASMNAIDCRWYGRRPCGTTMPSGTAASSGHTCCTRVRISSHVHVLRAGYWCGAAGPAAAVAAGAGADAACRACVLASRSARHFLSA